MGWIWRITSELYHLALGKRSSWSPRDFGAAIEEALGERLTDLGFANSDRVLPTQQNGYINTIEYKSSQFKVEFYWDRQSIDGELTPLDLEILPRDLTLTPLAIERSNHQPPFSLWQIFRFCGLLSNTESKLLSTPGRFQNELEVFNACLPKLRVFVEGSLEIYIPFRRYAEINQLEYTWEERNTYKDTERITNQTLDECREYAQLWWADEDYVSVAGVLAVIEAELTEDERRQLKIARRKAKEIQRRFYKEIAKI